MVTQERGIEAQDVVFKHEDTTRQITLKFHQDRYTYFRPDNKHTFTAKVANKSGLVDQFPANPDYDSIIVTSASMVKLPPDDYTMEIWETWTDDNGTKQTAIWPTPQMRINFKIEENIDDKTGEVIEQLGFQDVVNKAVEQAGLNLVVKAKTGDPETDVTVDQQYQDGKNVITLTIPKGRTGDKGDDGKSAYQEWLDQGNTGTLNDFLDSLKGTDGGKGDDGKSAYQVWLDQGNTGTEQDFLNSLKGTDGGQGDPGPAGKSAYQVWLDQGNSGTEADFIASLKGTDGKTPDLSNYATKDEAKSFGFTKNILYGADPVSFRDTGDIDNRTFKLASGGNGTGNLIDLDDNFVARKGFNIHDNTQGSKDYNERPIIYNGGRYTAGIWVRLTPGVDQTSATAYVRSWSLKQERALMQINFTVDSTEWVHKVLTFDSKDFYTDSTSSFAFGVTDNAKSVDFAEPMLVEGEVVGNLLMNPQEVDERLNKIEEALAKLTQTT